MTKEKLREICRKDGLYTADPSLNDRLYLHFKGFRTLNKEALAPYTGVKVLWLEGNGLTSLGNGALSNQKQLTTLYLHENCLETLKGESGDDDEEEESSENQSEEPIGLQECTELDTLNASKNVIRRIEGLEKCTKLKVSRSTPSFLFLFFFLFLSTALFFAFCLPLPFFCFPCRLFSFHTTPSRR